MDQNIPADIKEAKMFAFGVDHKRIGPSGHLNWEELLVAQYRSRAEKRRAEEKGKRSPVKKVLLIIIGVFIVGMVAATAVAASMISDAPELNAEELTFAEGATIYDMNDNELGRLQGTENRTYRDIDEMPEHLKNAFIAVEDYRFYEHSGIDLYRIGGAVVSNITGGFGSEGASTITQQLVKQAFLSADQSIERKVQEQWLALQMEQEYSKDEILEMYLNISYFDSSAWGIGEAAIRYFDKESLDELTIADSAVLAAIPRRPSYYNPQNNPEEAEQRRDLIISLMEEHELISEDEATDAMAVDIEDQLDYTPPEDVALQSIIDQVMEEVESIDGIETTDLYAAGFDIYTTIDPEAQEIAQDVIQSDEYIDQYPDNDEFQVGFSLLDTETGAIRAMVGNREETEEERGLNYATSANGQPGSTIKPILDYGPAIEELGWYTGETLVDEPHEYSDGTSIRNYGGSYSGEVSMREALVRSLNIPAVKAIQEVGLGDAQAFAEDLGLDFEGDITEGYALGGFQDGISSLDMAAANAAFGNEGTYNEPHSVRKVEFRDGREIENAPESDQVMYESTAYMMSDMLKDVVGDSSGTGQRANIEGLPLAGKTGTSNFDQEDRQNHDIPDGGVPDVWFNGYTTDYTAAVWTGFDGERGSNYLLGEERDIAQDIFRIIMTNVHEGEGTEDFSRPNSVCDTDGELYRCENPPAEAIEEEEDDEEGSEEETPETPEEEGIEEDEPEEEEEDDEEDEDDEEEDEVEEEEEDEEEDEDEPEEEEDEDDEEEDEDDVDEEEQDESEEEEEEDEEEQDENEEEDEEEEGQDESEEEDEEEEGQDENEEDDEEEEEDEDADGEEGENAENEEDTDE
ncbi:PBP1A family penicillin-binding protein [Salicibibacter halophilus]|uniref:PBP1A family penicillin-binding protein n=1 Tax=Salicibibacter halophilus TaxID=2502791 RepID=A0A514LHU0_9BACI|nr:PBP1A family penicillin-binding protein [Salicibibacter halophilus]QDI90861.1 PBP1A family penicillin-binding protein [Salicibibacter halophilus]